MIDIFLEILELKCLCYFIEGSGKSLNVSTGSLKSHNSLFVPGAQQGKDFICSLYQYQKSPSQTYHVIL